MKKEEMPQPIETNLTGSLEAKLEALFQAALDDAFRAALASTVETALKYRGKEPIVANALYLLKQVGILCGYSYPSVYHAAITGHLKVIETAVGRQAWGRDVKAWINAGGKTGRSLATM